MQILGLNRSNFWPKIKKQATVGDHRFFADPVSFAGPIGSPMKCSNEKNVSRIRQSFCVQITSQVLTPYPWDHLKQYHRSQIANLYHIYIIIGVRAKSATFGHHRLFANFGGFAGPIATYEMSLKQKSSKFAVQIFPVA